MITSKRLLTAISATSVLLLAAPSLADAAVAARGPHRTPRAHKRALSAAGCRISLAVEPHRITSGETPQLFGRLTCPNGTETTGQTVTAYGRSAGAPASVLGTATTVAGGFYTVVAPATTANTIFYTAAAGAISPSRPVVVAPQVTLSGPSEGKALFTGLRSRVTFAGTVTPADPGATVVLQREAATADEEWVPIQRGVLGPGGAYDLVHTFVVPGDANIRVVVRAHGLVTVYGASSPISYVITQKENPLLTLLATSTAAASDPIPYGQSVTLKGTVAGGANKAVTLLARTAGGSFATVASSPADGSGQYSFSVTPRQNTSYKVAGANGAHSTILFEGVKYALAAAFSAASLPAGQTLTVTGTVSPYHAGHLIYLERQNADGAGFHVVAVGVENPPAAGSESATYSVTHTVFGMGRQVYRVKVPGDPDNLGQASQTFPVEVTPAPPGSLHPVPQGTLPREGQI